MDSSSGLAEVASALVKVQSRLRPVARTSTNPFFKSNYADLSAVWETIRQPLADNGLAVVQTLDAVEDRGVIALSTLLLHTSGEWIRSTLTMPLQKTEPQAVGSAITYARRYALMAMIGVAAADEDDDAEGATDQKHRGPRYASKNSEAPTIKVETETKPPIEMKKELAALIRDLGLSVLDSGPGKPYRVALPVPVLAVLGLPENSPPQDIKTFGLGAYESILPVLRKLRVTKAARELTEAEEGLEADRDAEIAENEVPEEERGVAG